MEEIQVGTRVKFGCQNELRGEVVTITPYANQLLAIVLLDKSCRGYVEATGTFIRMMVADIGGLVIE